jgi:hypothetical protein
MNVEVNPMRSKLMFTECTSTEEASKATGPGDRDLEIDRDVRGPGRPNGREMLPKLLVTKASRLAGVLSTLEAYRPRAPREPGIEERSNCWRASGDSQLGAEPETSEIPNLSNEKLRHSNGTLQLRALLARQLLKHRFLTKVLPQQLP